MLFYEIGVVVVAALKTSALEVANVLGHVSPHVLGVLVADRDDGTRGRLADRLQTDAVFLHPHTVEFRGGEERTSRRAKVDKHQATALLHVHGTVTRRAQA